MEPASRSPAALLDDALGAGAKGFSCNEVANTIFPDSLWNPRAGIGEVTLGLVVGHTRVLTTFGLGLFGSRLRLGFQRRHGFPYRLPQRYRRIMPRVLRDRRNRYGVYFQRLIAYGHDDTYNGGVNQLEHVIQTWRGGNHRRSALQAAIFDPTKDHTNQRMRGFPCLQQVAFAPQDADGLMVTGLYATQYMFERAYGNYLGLCRLGRFMAQEMGKQLTQVTCVASPANGGNKTKSYLRELARDVEGILDRLQESG